MSVKKLRQFIQIIFSSDEDVLLTGEDFQAAKAAAQWIQNELENKAHAGKQSRRVKRNRPNIKPYEDLSPSGKWKRDRKENQ